MIAQDAYFIYINQVFGQCRILKYSTFYSEGQKGGGKWSYKTKLQQFWCRKPELTIKEDFRGKYKMLLKYTIWLLLRPNENWFVVPGSKLKDCL